jgi:hypothetical protein
VIILYIAGHGNGWRVLVVHQFETTSKTGKKRGFLTTGCLEIVCKRSSSLLDLRTHRREMGSVSDPKPLVVVCSICHKPIELETNKFDATGQPVHEECYFLKITGKKITGKTITGR